MDTQNYLNMTMDELEQEIQTTTKRVAALKKLLEARRAFGEMTTKQKNAKEHAKKSSAKTTVKTDAKADAKAEAKTEAKSTPAKPEQKASSLDAVYAQVKNAQSAPSATAPSATSARPQY